MVELVPASLSLTWTRPQHGTIINWLYTTALSVDKGNNKITELRTILQRESRKITELRTILQRESQNS